MAEERPWKNSAEKALKVLRVGTREIIEAVKLAAQGKPDGADVVEIAKKLGVIPPTSTSTAQLVDREDGVNIARLVAVLYDLSDQGSIECTGVPHWKFLPVASEAIGHGRQGGS